MSRTFGPGLFSQHECPVAGSAADVLGPLPINVWLEQIELTIVADGTATLTLAPVIGRTLTADIASITTGESLVDHSQASVSDKPAIELQLALGTPVFIVLPIGTLIQERDLFFGWLASAIGGTATLIYVHSALRASRGRRQTAIAPTQATFRPADFQAARAPRPAQPQPIGFLQERPPPKPSWNPGVRNRFPDP